MPSKDPEQRRATARAWYARTKAAIGAEALERRGKNRRARRYAIIAWFVELKSSLACARCPEAHRGCLQFHHADPTHKEVSIADAVRRGWKRERILAELDKCEVLCANCHAKHHAREAVA